MIGVTSHGFLVLMKRAPKAQEGAEIFVLPRAVAAIEPHNLGCFVHIVGGGKLDVAHSHAELMNAISSAAPEVNAASTA